MYFNLTKRIFYDDGSTSGATTEEKDVKVNDLTEDQIDDMGQDDLDRVQFDEDSDEAILKAPAKPKEDEKPLEPVEKDEKKPVEGDDDEKKPEEDEKPPKPTIDEDIKTIEDIPKEERTEEQTVELRRLNSERRMHVATQEAADLRKERDALQEKLYNKELEGEEEEPERLTEEEYDELPPEEQTEYKTEIEKYETRQEQKVVQQSSQSFRNLAAFYKTLKNSNETVEDLIKLKADPDSKSGYKYSNAEFGEWIKSDEFQTFDAEVTGMRKQYDGTYSVEQMQKAFFTVNKEKLLSDAQRTGREQALTDIDSANSSDASKLDMIPKTDGKKGLKRVSDLSDEEIDNMGVDEYKAYVETMEREGMA